MASEGTVVRVVPDVAGIEKEFDYLVPFEMAASVRPGTLVRVTLANRRVGAWVVATDVDTPEGVKLKAVNKISSVGPDEKAIDLAGWAARHWLGKRSFFLQTASPLRNVGRLPDPGPLTRTPTAHSVTVQRWAPASDPMPVVEEALAHGPTLLIVPTQRAAERWARRLREAGHPVASYPDDWAKVAAGGVHVVGTRAAAFAPLPDMAAAIVLDAHDEALQSERSPTWNALEVVIERGRREKAPVTLVSPVPRSELLALGDLRLPDREVERKGWSPLHVVDLRRTDPRTGIYSPALVQLLRSDKRVVCVLNRKGRSQLLVCHACDEVAACERCEGAMVDRGEGFVCRRCDNQQPKVCRNCGSGRFKQLRPGVSRVREDLESLALRPVGEVTAEADALPDSQVLIGTEAVLQRVGRTDAVIFVDFDQELMASRYRTAEDALVLLARASRITGGRNGDGIVMVQTRQPESEVIEAALHGDPGRLQVVEAERRAQMGWPPYGRLVALSGEGAPGLVESLPADVMVMGPDEGRFLLRADDRQRLVEVLTPLWEKGNKTRIEFDPPRV